MPLSAPCRVTDPARVSGAAPGRPALPSAGAVRLNRAARARLAAAGHHVLRAAPLLDLRPTRPQAGQTGRGGVGWWSGVPAVGPVSDRL